MAAKTTSEKIKSIVLNELAKTRENEQRVVRGRFGISEKKMTLSAIGREMKLSRERIRQIEREGLKKLSKFIVNDYPNEIKFIVSAIEKHGGVISKSESAKKIYKAKNASEEDNNILNLFIRILPQIENLEKKDHIYDSWVISSLPKDEVIKILSDWTKHLRKLRNTQKIDVLIEAHPNQKKHKISFLGALPKISKKIVETAEGELGLNEWPEIMPKTVKDKIYFVLRKNQSPMHFSEIARAISKENFDQKKVVTATVHNELISDKRFILIGRGLYALSEWGYKEGTVKEIIISVLKESSGVMDFADIYSKVSKQRTVRKNTVMINLQTQKEFKKVGENKFTLA